MSKSLPCCTRRAVLAAGLVLALPAAASAPQDVVHRDRGCGCCELWVRIVRAELGRDPAVVDNTDRAALHARLGLPADLASCHTAIFDGLAFEGHVPPRDIARLLATRPAGVRGLAVAGMPLGSPGMEVPGPRDAYDVIAFGPGLRRVFAHYPAT